MYHTMRGGVICLRLKEAPPQSATPRTCCADLDTRDIEDLHVSYNESLLSVFFVIMLHLELIVMISKLARRSAPYLQ